MTRPSLYSAPNEEYTRHIELCLEKFELLFPFFKSTFERVFGTSDNLQSSLRMMIAYHDLGKLTEKWQENLGKNRSLPAHAPFGASYLWKVLPQGLREPLSFAVAIHHSDSGLLSDNIERPDVQAILDGIVNFQGEIIWSDRAFELPDQYFPEDARELTVYDLKDMARGLRVWARGEGFLEQHRRRLQATLAHHLLKLCDVSSASERGRDTQEKEIIAHQGGFSERGRDTQEKETIAYQGGLLMVKEIVKYVEDKKIFHLNFSGG